MRKNKENKIVVKKRIGIGQYILAFCLILYTVF